MMPHPDRSSEKAALARDGWKIFASMVEARGGALKVELKGYES